MMAAVRPMGLSGPYWAIKSAPTARAALPLGNVASKLYKKPGTSQYYLVLSSQSADPVVFSRVCNLLAEYGEKIRTDAAGEAYYQEHYEIIVRAHALEKMALI